MLVSNSIVQFHTEKKIMLMFRVKHKVIQKNIARTPGHWEFAQFPIRLVKGLVGFLDHKIHQIGNCANCHWPGVLVFIP